MWKGAIALAACCLVAAADDEDRRAAVDRLKEIRRSIDKTSAGLAFIKKAAWAAWVVTGREAFSDAAEAIEKLEEPAETLDDMVGRLEDAVDPDARKPPAGLLEQVKKVARQADEVRRLADRVRAAPAGLVSAELDPRFEVSADLLARSPKEAERRLGALLKAMERNVEWLDETSDALDELALRARGAAAVMERLRDGIEKAAGAGLFGTLLVSNYLDVDRLATECGGLAADAGAKADAMRKASEEQDRRLDNLRSNMESIFGRSP